MEQNRLQQALSMPNINEQSYQNIAGYPSLSDLSHHSRMLDFSSFMVDGHPFEDMCRIEADTKVLLEDFCSTIDKVMSSDKPFTES